MKFFLHKEPTSDFSTPEMTLQCIINFIVISVITVIPYLFALKARRRIIFPFLFLFFLTIIFTISFLILIKDSPASEQPLFFLAPLCFPLAILLAFIVYFKNLKTSSAYESLLELQKLHELESSTYQEIERQSEAYAKIRHDYNNQLIVINSLIESGDYENAKNFAEELRKQL